MALKRGGGVAAVPAGLRTRPADDLRVATLETAVADLRRREEFAAEIAKLWTDAQERFVLIGRYLLRAKDRLPHGEFEHMVERDLPFGKQVAYQLRIVAEAIDGQVLPADRLPNSYSTIFLLANMAPEERQAAERAELIRPTVTRAEVTAFIRRLKAERRPADQAGQGKGRRALERERRDVLEQIERLRRRLQDIDRELGGAVIEGDTVELSRGR